MRVQITKPMRMTVAKALHAVCCEVFPDHAWPKPRHDGDDCEIGDVFDSRQVVRISTGELSVWIEVCPRMVSAFCRLAPNAGVGVPLTADEVALAALVGGNTYSGQVNAHLTPQGGKCTASDVSGFALTLRHHLMTLKHATRAYA